VKSETQNRLVISPLLELAGHTRSKFLERHHPIDQHKEGNQQEQDPTDTPSVRRQPPRVIRNRGQQADPSAQTPETRSDSGNDGSLETWFHEAPPLMAILHLQQTRRSLLPRHNLILDLVAGCLGDDLFLD
jgi:hypothetical protein